MFSLLLVCLFVMYRLSSGQFVTSSTKTSKLVKHDLFFTKVTKLYVEFLSLGLIW